MKRKLLSILVLATFILTGCKKTQNQMSVWLTDDQNTSVKEQEYAIPSDSLKLTIHKIDSLDTYVLIQSKEADKDEIKEDLVELKSDEDKKEYIFDNIKDIPTTYAIYTDITIDGDKATINENAVPNVTFNLRKQTEADKQAIEEAQQQEQEKKNQNKEEFFGRIVFEKYLEDNTFIKPKTFRGKYNVATQKYNDKHTAYIVTYSDNENDRIKLIFDYTGDLEKANEDPFEELVNVDYWYYLENGEEIYNEMDAKRENAMKDQ